MLSYPDLLGTYVLRLFPTVAFYMPIEKDDRLSLWLDLSWETLSILASEFCFCTLIFVSYALLRSQIPAFWLLFPFLLLFVIIMALLLLLEVVAILLLGSLLAILLLLASLVLFEILVGLSEVI